jgi:hypothetical protein
MMALPDKYIRASGRWTPRTSAQFLSYSALQSITLPKAAARTWVFLSRALALTAMKAVVQLINPRLRQLQGPRGCTAGCFPPRGTLWLLCMCGKRPGRSQGVKNGSLIPIDGQRGSLKSLLDGRNCYGTALKSCLDAAMSCKTNGRPF